MLSGTVEGETLVPVLRGSLLMREWFADAARPAADIDLECFVTDPEDEQRVRYGPYEEYETRVDYGKAMCRYSAERTMYYGWNEDAVAPPVQFRPPPEEAYAETSLWVYGTPGERYFSQWAWEARGLEGVLQIDIAEPGNYSLDDIAPRPIQMKSLDGEPFEFPAYTPETLLAAKLSWLMRSFTRVKGGAAPVWSGEPKDIFDAHLLLSREIDAERFQHVMLAVGAQDAVEWGNLEALFEAGVHAMPDDEFRNWEPFREEHPQLDVRGPSQLVREIADALEPLLGPFRPAGEVEFLTSIDDDRERPDPFLVYADWLEERGDARGPYLRALTALAFPDAATTAEADHAIELLSNPETPKPPEAWVHRVFGTSAHAREIRDGL